MASVKQLSSEEKSGLHPRNKHRFRYDFEELIKSCPDLARFVKPNQYKDLSIDFFNPEAVKMLNKALLQHFYQLDYWDIPPSYLCPPIPGRADYIHYMADLLLEYSLKFRLSKPLANSQIKCLDIGVGANAVYPIIGNSDYGWSFVGSDIDPKAIESATKILNRNKGLKGNVELRLQPNASQIFRGIIQENEHFDITICNPPFHSSAAEAQAVSIQKLSNLKKGAIAKPILNFGGQSNELWCKGGEVGFLNKMIAESKEFSSACFWFSTLVSKSSNLKVIYASLKLLQATEVRTIPMQQGNKISRVVAWTFLQPDEQAEWIKSRW